jgi:pimeloyl-ACP methyl ester carboxylesterase
MEKCFTGYDGIFKRLYFDLPGFGKTKGNEWLSSADKMLELIIEFIEGVIPDQAFLLVGNSYGGYLARGIVKKKQKMVKGLFLLCPFIQNKMQVPKRSVLEKDHALDGILSDEEKSYFEQVVVRQTNIVWSRFKEEILPGLKMADYAFIKNDWGKKSAFTIDVDNLEYPLEKPVLIIMGKQDSMTGYSESWDFLKIYPRASLAILDNAGHALQIEQPELFHCLTVEWLERIIYSERKENSGD